jgi:hypothetical protein
MVVVVVVGGWWVGAHPAQPVEYFTETNANDRKIARKHLIIPVNTEDIWQTIIDGDRSARQPQSSTECRATTTGRKHTQPGPGKIQHIQHTPQIATIASNASDTIIVSTEKKEQSCTASLWSQRVPQGTPKCPKCGRYRGGCGDAAMRYIPVKRTDR